MNHSVKKLQGNWNYPTTIWFGCGRINDLAKACKSLGMSLPLLVTSAGFAERSIVQDAIKANIAAGIPTDVFSDVKPNPNGENVEAGLTQFRANNHDGIIAFGGGSALDAGKAIALMAGQSLPIWEFEDVGDNWLRVKPQGVVPIIAVPTTAGTGSEVGRASVIVDEATHTKKIIFHPKMLPSIVIADPELTVSLPVNLTAATGMDALSHNLEAFCSPSYHPMADGIALEGIRLIKEHLVTACKEPENLLARSQMMIASSMGATAFQKGLGAMHAVAHPLGALYDAHHGLLNAILMPYVLVRNQSAIDEKMQLLARYLGLQEVSFNGVVTFVRELRKEIEIPDTLLSIGIDDARKQLVGEMAAVDPSAGGNPIPFTSQQYTDLFQDAVNGTGLAFNK